MPLPGQPKDAPIPQHLNKWNWGAFLLNWIWGLGNSTYIALLMFVPLVNIVMLFVLGAKGSKWAWKNRLWEDEAHFQRVRRNWARAGFIVVVALFVFGFWLFSLLSGSEAQKLAMAKVRSDPQTVETLGEPIEAGWLTTGSVSVSGERGSARLAIPLSGPKSSGQAIVHGEKKDGKWVLYLLIVRVEGKSTPLVLINTRNLKLPGSGVDT